MADKLVGWSVSWMIDWFVGPMDRLVGPLAGRLVGGFAHVGLITDLHFYLI